MRLVWASLSALVASLASVLEERHLPAAIAHAGRDYWIISEAYRAERIGRFSSAEVAVLRARVDSIVLPFDFWAPGAFRPPASPPPHRLRAWDGTPSHDRGPIGGLIEDYWLNAHWALRMEQVYYRPETEGGAIGNRVEQLRVISAHEAYKPLPRYLGPLRGIPTAVLEKRVR